MSVEDYFKKFLRQKLTFWKVKSQRVKGFNS